jgi:hypothetical protein
MDRRWAETLESRKKRVRDLYFVEGKNTREIAKIERISIRDISKILKGEEARKQDLEDDSQKQLEGRLLAEAYTLFEKGKTPTDVVIKLEGPQVANLYKEYLKLKGLSEAVSLYEKIEDDAWSYLELYKLANSSVMSNTEIVKAVDIALNKLPLADENYFRIREKANELVETELQQRHDNEVLKGKNFSLIKEMSDLEAQKHELIEYCNRRKEELEELREEQQQVDVCVSSSVYLIRICC